MSAGSGSPMRYVVWGLILLLAILHQDIWFWSEDWLVFGFMPVTLLYHAGISVAAGFCWWLATIFAWPEDLIEETKVEADLEHREEGAH